MNTAPRHRPNLPARALKTLVLVLGLACFAHAQSTGIVSGQVSNAATTVFLEGVEVSVEGANRSVVTDREGRYELILPPGPVTLVARYTGLEPQRVTVDVTPGARAVQNIGLSSGIYKMEAFTVSGPPRRQRLCDHAAARGDEREERRLLR